MPLPKQIRQVAGRNQSLNLNEELPALSDPWAGSSRQSRSIRVGGGVGPSLLLSEVLPLVSRQRPHQYYSDHYEQQEYYR